MIPTGGAILAVAPDDVGSVITDTCDTIHNTAALSFRIWSLPAPDALSLIGNVLLSPYRTATCYRRPGVRFHDTARSSICITVAVAVRTEIAVVGEYTMAVNASPDLTGQGSAN